MFNYGKFLSWLLSVLKVVIVLVVVYECLLEGTNRILLFEKSEPHFVIFNQMNLSLHVRFVMPQKNGNQVENHLKFISDCHEPEILCIHLVSNLVGKSVCFSYAGNEIVNFLVSSGSQLPVPGREEMRLAVWVRKIYKTLLIYNNVPLIKYILEFLCFLVMVVPFL